MLWPTKVSSSNERGSKGQLLGCPLISTHGMHILLHTNIYIHNPYTKIRKQVSFFKLVDRDQQPSIPAISVDLTHISGLCSHQTYMSYTNTCVGKILTHLTANKQTTISRDNSWKSDFSQFQYKKICHLIITLNIKAR